MWEERETYSTRAQKNKKYMFLYTNVNVYIIIIINLITAVVTLCFLNFRFDVFFFFNYETVNNLFLNLSFERVYFFK